VFIAHGRRELVHVKVTANPTAPWVWQQVIEATSWGHQPRHLLRDRDAVYGCDFRARAERIGIDAIASPMHAPKANAIAERVTGTLRRDCLDHLIVLNEQHLASVLTEFVRYYNQDRRHRTLGLHTPQPRPRPTTGPDLLASSPEWAALRLRTRRLTATEVWPSDTRDQAQHGLDPCLPGGGRRVHGVEV
jgi:transposase InsO family protein